MHHRLAGRAGLHAQALRQLPLGDAPVLAQLRQHADAAGLALAQRADGVADVPQIPDQPALRVLRLVARLPALAVTGAARPVFAVVRLVRVRLGVIAVFAVAVLAVAVLAMTVFAVAVLSVTVFAVAVLAMAVLTVAVLTVAVFTVAVFSVAVFSVAVLAVTVLAMAVFAVAMLAISVLPIGVTRRDHAGAGVFLSAPAVQVVHGAMSAAAGAILHFCHSRFLPSHFVRYRNIISASFR